MFRGRPRARSFYPTSPGAGVKHLLDGAVNPTAPG